MNKNLLIVFAFLLFNLGYGQTITTSVINVSGGNTVYGEVTMNPGSFLVYGTNINQRITVTPPFGYEVSRNGTVYTDTAIISTPTGGIGDITGILIYIRLKGTIPVGNYGAVNFYLTSPGAVDASVYMGRNIVNKNTLIVAAGNATKKYGDPNPVFTVSYDGFRNGDNETNLITPIKIETTADETSGAGLYNITVTGGESPNYDISDFPGTLTITKAPLTIKTNNDARKYGEDNPAFTVGYNGFVNGDTEANLTTKPTISTLAVATSPVGKYDITASDAVSSNYDISYPAPKGVLDVTPAKLTITTKDNSKVYGSVNPDLTVGYSGFVNGDTEANLTTKPTIATLAVTTSPVGKYEITATGAASSNYEIGYGTPNGFLDVTPAKLIITTDSYTRKYGEDNQAFAVKYSGFVNGDTESNLTTKPTISTLAVATSPVGKYDITASGAVSSNYDISYPSPNGSLDVTPAKLIIATESYTRKYGEDNPAFTVTYSGFVNGDTEANLTTKPTISTLAVATSPVGKYDITASDAVSSNYDISYAIPKGFLDVTRATLTITTVSDTRKYGEDNPAFTVDYKGFVNGETEANLTTKPTISTLAVATSPIGKYDITASGAASSNYDISYVTPKGFLDVTPAKLTITADSFTKAHGEKNPALTVQYSGFVNGDNETNLTGKPVVTTTADTDSTIGEYPIIVTVDGVASPNYIIEGARGTLKVVASSDAGLSDIVVSNGSLDQPVTPNEKGYTVEVPNNVDTYVVTPVPSNPNATVEMIVDGKVVDPANPIDLKVGDNPITINVTAEDGTTIETYTVIVTRDPSNNSGLTDLIPSAGTLEKPFETGIKAYTDVVENDVTNITLTPVTADPTATITVNGVPVPSGTASTEIPLQVGENTITTVVTAEDGTSTTYTVVVTRKPSDNSGLTDLAISEGTLSPAFTEENTVYTAEVGNDVAGITVTPFTSDPTATITVNGVPVPSGTASPNLPLVVGENTIETVVTAEDGTTTTYTVIVTRDPSDNAGLTDITVSEGTLNPVFDTDTHDYKVDVPNTTDSIVVTPVIADPTATVEMMVDGKVIDPANPIDLKVGDNVITVVVTAEDGTTKEEYNVIVTREEAPLSNNSGLTDLTPNAGTLSPVFAEGTTVYADTVPNDVTSITLTPVTADSTATVTVNGVEVPSETASAQIPLVVGENTITTVVTAQDGTTTTYTVVVTREPSDEAGLADITVSDGSLDPAFNTDMHDYKVDVPFETDSIVITPVTIDPTATVAMIVDGQTVDPTAPIDLKVGDNVITVIVTAEDGTQETYTVIVNRADDVPPVIVPSNIITPNGDGKNDFWVIPGIDKYPANSVKVFDRAARLVYSKDNYNNEWDGTYKGSPLTEDTYYYLIDLGSGLPKVKGFITIVRD